MKKAIITGAGGFVGRAVVKELLAHNIEVTAIDIRLPEKYDNPGAVWVEADIQNIWALEQHPAMSGADTFYHFAWRGSAGPERTDEAIQLANAVQTAGCLRFAKKLGCTRFVGAGSIMETEILAAMDSRGTRPGPAYIYGSGKLAAHTICESVAAAIDIDLVWARITNAYGAGEVSPRFINTTLRKIIRSEPLEFTAATQNYDFVYVDDVALAFYLLGEKGRPFCTYVISSGGAKPLKEFIVELADSVSKGSRLGFGEVPFTGINIPLSAFDCTPLMEDTGFVPRLSFAEGIRRTMSWLMEQEDK